tara:strand:+ start:3210 stop:3932 length:723 start_codon:yes stop_codon:yes gene_type:complete
LAFQESAYSKKPGRVVKRVSKHVSPAFDVVHLAQWDKVMKAVFAVRLASVRETDVFDMHADEEKVFSERSVIISDLLMLSKGGDFSAKINISANISHHAISRLLERGASNPELIENDVLEILQQARSLRDFLSSGLNHSLTKLKDGMTYDLIVPYRDGALILRTLRINATQQSFFSSPMPVFSVRTYLDNSMLSDRQHARMEGFRLSRDPLISNEDCQRTLAWLQKNAEETDPRRRLMVE